MSEGPNQQATRLREACLINGLWVDALLDQRFTVKNPANGVSIGTVPGMQPPDITAAIDAAATAFESWRRSLPATRAKHNPAIAETLRSGR